MNDPIDKEVTRLNNQLKRGTRIIDAFFDDGSTLSAPVPVPKPLAIVGNTGDLTYGQIPMVLMNDPKLSTSAKLVWAYLHFRQGKNDIAWPSQETIAEHTRMSRSTVSRAVLELEEFGWIRIRRAFKSNQRLNSYRICFPEDVKVKVLEAFKNEQPKNQKDTTSQSKLDTSLPQNDAVKTPSITPIKNTNKTPSRSRSPIDFEAFFKSVE
jgi:hypothetical protein